jgi:hypothetical protein
MVNFCAKPQRGEAATNLFGLRREAKRHAALEALSAVEKQCRRCALPPQSKILTRVNVCQKPRLLLPAG